MENITETDVKNISRDVVPDAWTKDLKFFSDLIARAETVNVPKIDTLNRLRERAAFKLATISLRMTSEDLSVRPAARQGAEEYVLYGLKSKERCEQFRQRLLLLVERAAKKGANVICANELAYPVVANQDGPDPGEAEFRKKLIEIAEHYNVFIVAGSFHDNESQYNLSPIFCGPISDERRENLADGLIMHAKLNSAVRAREQIRIPPNRRVRIYETIYGRIGVLICIDVYDPQLVCRLMLYNAPAKQREKIDLVLVPSFSVEKSETTAEACRDLSYGMACTVAYVNCLANHPRHQVWIAGTPAEDLPGCRRTPASRAKEAELNIWTIPAGVVNGQRNLAYDTRTQLFKVLLGEREGTRGSIRVG